MVFSLYLIIIVSLIHIFAAVIWVGGNFFELMTLVPALKRNSQAVQEEIATTVPLQEHKNSAIFATIAIIAGPILAYLYSNGDMAIFVNTSWGLSITAGGITALVLYFVGWYAGSLRVKLADLNKKVISSGVDQHEEGSQEISTVRADIGALSSRLTKMIYVENALGALVLAFMILAGAL